MKYLVKIAWRAEFMFDNIEEAATFVSTAIQHRIPGDDNDEIVIKVIEEGKEEE